MVVTCRFPRKSYFLLPPLGVLLALHGTQHLSELKEANARIVPNLSRLDAEQYHLSRISPAPELRHVAYDLRASKPTRGTVRAYK